VALAARAMTHRAFTSSPLYFVGSLKHAIEFVVERSVIADRAREFRLHADTLMARQGALAQLGPQLLDVIVKRNHGVFLSSG
jgi:hypothetical protein